MTDREALQMIADVCANGEFGLLEARESIGEIANAALRRAVGEVTDEMVKAAQEFFVRQDWVAPDEQTMRDCLIAAAQARAK